MENLLLLILFAYTGGIMEFVYEAFAKGKSFYREPSSALRTARSFFLSLPCTITALAILKRRGVEGLDTLSGIIQTLRQTDAVLPFIAWSVVAAVIGGCLWYGVHLLVIKWYNHHVNKSGKGYCSTKLGTTWADFSANPESIDAKKCIAIIYKGERMVEAGCVASFSDDFSKDKGIVLTRCEEVREELQKDEDESLIGIQIATYYDATTDMKIELRHASSLTRKWYKSK